MPNEAGGVGEALKAVAQGERTANAPVAAKATKAAAAGGGGAKAGGRSGGGGGGGAKKKRK